jgi:hypothetical protein
MGRFYHARIRPKAVAGSATITVEVEIQRVGIKTRTAADFELAASAE